ncbi:MAG: type I pullulanase [Elusimicrobia bacterium]|nr:type I pullulanase [Elusimicrobiota bacterium]
MKKSVVFIFFCGVISMNLNSYSQNSLTLHYNRLNGDYEGWSMWVWNEEDKKKGFEIPPHGKSDFGIVFKIDADERGLSGKNAGFLPKYKNWEKKDGSDRFFRLKNAKEIFMVEADPEVYAISPEISTRIISAEIENANQIKIVFTRVVDREFISNQSFYVSDGIMRHYPEKIYFKHGADSGSWALFSLHSDAKMGFPEINEGKWALYSRNFGPIALRLGDIVYGDYFKTDKELGVIFKEEKTIIRIFSPRAKSVSILLYDDENADSSEYPADYSGNGVWEKVFTENIVGKYYKIRVKEGDRVFEGIDPYARYASSHDGKALIVKDKTSVFPPPVFDLAETIIYEMHIRDFTIDENSGVKNRGKYSGLAEENSTHKNFKELLTGIDHLIELGINAVHIMPFQDFENNEASGEYNWGYMPVNFNSPDGWYAIDRKEKIREAKEMISAFHRKGIKVFMDVVYNHTAETDSKIRNFNAAAPGYYYRIKENGEYWNGSGCGNEFKTEAPMARKFILDSLVYWVKEYGIDGFRFDLMGLVDKETVFEIVKKLNAIKPGIIIYGEPWTCGPTPVDGIKKGSQKSKGFAVFNDNFRDAIKGSVFEIKDLGYVQSGKNRDAVMRGIMGSISDFTDSPLETVNYVSCHDNHTLWDRIDLSAKDAVLNEKIKMDKLAQAIILTSQGIPFLHSGEEFLRTKTGEENSYNLPDSVNMIDWTLKKTHYGVFSFYRDLIHLRKWHPGFRMKTAEQIKENLKFYEESGLRVEKPCIAYKINGKNSGDEWEEIIVLINPTRKPVRFFLPEGSYLIGFDAGGIYAGKKEAVSSGIEVPAITMMILHSEVAK